jgi:glycine/D-amino acid oxidase-like deaminating enzyme
MLRVGTVENVLLDHKRKSVVGVVVDGEQIDANVVVIAMGPWTVQAAAWLPLPVVYGSKSYSIVLRNSTNPPAEALFVEFEDEHGEWHCPEVFTRADGTTYLCGFGDNAPVPDSPREVWVDEEACDRLQSVASQLSGALGNAELVHRQACYRPICHDAMPVIGNLDGISGAYIATGHNCWGMLNAPATAYALAELIADGESRTVDLKPFAPSRLALARESRS